MTVRAKLRVLDSGEVVQVRPAMLSVASAALYLAVSASKLNALRTSDAKALREGRELAGPRWVVLGGTMVRYRIADLDEWAQANAKEFATVEAFRGGTESAEPSP